MTDSSKSWNPSLEKLSNAFKTEFADLSDEFMSTAPAKNQWSINEIMSHIKVVNESYYPIFEKVISGKYTPSLWGNFAFIRNFFGKIILKSVQPENQKKQKTLPIWHPEKSNIHVNQTELLIQHFKELSAKIKELDNAIKRNATIASPANELIVYDLTTGLYIIVTHAWRHYYQALRAKNEIKTILLSEK